MQPLPPPTPAATVDIIDALRARIRAIERSPTPMLEERGNDGSCWTTGAAAIDAALGPAGLEIGAVHEIKPVAAGADWPAAWAAARGFALALAARRLAACAGLRPGSHLLWCASTAMTAEHGALYGPGLRALGLDPARLVVVETARVQDALWALEEGLKSDSLALVMAQLDDVDLTPARRLALAAARAQTPCLLLTHPRHAPAAATATRWRIGPAPSAPHPLDAHAPGTPRFTVAIERCRGRPPVAQDLSLMLEWCDAAYRFRVVPAVADRAHAASPPRARAAAAGP